MKPIILKLAKDDLREIYEQLFEYGMNTQKNFRESFEKFCILVENMPYIYSRYEPNPKYRRAVIEYGYSIFYQVDDLNRRVKVYRVLHGKRDIKNHLDDD